MTRRTVANLAAVGAFALCCLTGLGFLSVSMGLEVPGVRQGWRLEAAFASVQGLVPQSDVDVSGVRVGRVIAIGPDGRGGSLVSMVIDPGVRLRQDTRALLRPKSPIGEKYVELVRRTGSTAPYAPDSYRLPRQQTGEAVEIDVILNQLDPETRAALSESLRELGVAVEDRHGDLGAAIPEVEQAAANLRPLARRADVRQREIDRILADLAIILADLADEQEALGRTIDSGNTTAAAVARRDSELAGTIREADRLFASLDVVLADTTLANRASLEKAPPTIGAGRQLLSTLDPAVDRLLPELLLAQVAYPNNQLAVSHPEAVSLAYEWISAFSQRDSQGHAFRITNIADPATNARQPALASPPGAPAAQGPGPGAGLHSKGQGEDLVPAAARVLLGLPG